MSIFSQIAKVTDHLYLRGAGAVTAEKLRQHGITLVVNLTLDWRNVELSGVESLHIHVDDVPNARLGVYFDRCADKIQKTKQKGGRALVHCMAGISRSSSVCIAYLMKYYRMTLKEAHAHVKSRRQIIRPNMGFWRQLIEYEQKLFGRTSVKMVSSPLGYVPDIYKAETRGMVWMTSNQYYGY